MGMREKGEISDYGGRRLLAFFFFFFSMLTRWCIISYILRYLLIDLGKKISAILFFIGDILSRANFVFLRNGSNVTESRIYSSRDDQQLHEKSSWISSTVRPAVTLRWPDWLTQAAGPSARQYDNVVAFGNRHTSLAAVSVGPFKPISRAKYVGDALPK